jgi:Domain of unknown function (DUF4166)
VAFRFPLLFSGVADVCEWFDDAQDRFRIDVNVQNRRWGPLFGYRGAFTVETRRDEESAAPSSVLPVRTERRE